MNPSPLKIAVKRCAISMRQCAFHLFAGDLDPYHLTVKAHAELAEAQRLDLFFPGLHGLHVLNGHRRSVRNAGTQTRRGGPVPGGQVGQAGQFADLRLGQSGIRQRRGHLVLQRGVLARTVVAEVVHVDAVDDVLVAALAAHLFQAREQLVLAVEAAVGTIAHVIGIVELLGRDVLVDDAEAFHEGLGIALVRFRKRSGIRRDGHCIGAQRAVRRPRQIGGVGAAGEGHDHAAHGRKIRQ